MATVRGLGAVRVGDAIGEPPPGEAVTAASRGRRSRPSSSRAGRAAGLAPAALTQLAEQDPLIDVRQDDHRHEIAVSLYGEVQKEVIQATLERDYGIAADFRETTTVCIERPARVGEAEEVIRAKTKTNITGRSSPLSTNPFMATLALRIEPAPLGSGIEFRSPTSSRASSRCTCSRRPSVRDPDGGLRPRGADRGSAGWQVTDCRVTMTDCGYASPGHDRGRLPAADPARPDDRARARRHGVCEPLADLALEMPAETAPGVLAALGRLGGRVTGQFSANGSRRSAVLPVARVRDAPAPAARAVDGGGDPRDAPGGYQPIGDDPPKPGRAPEPARPRKN